MSNNISKRLGKMVINNTNEETKFRNSKRFRNVLRELYNISNGREGHKSYIPRRVIARYILRGVTVKNAINELERRVKQYNKLNKILTHSENFNANRFQKFIQTGLNRGMLSNVNAATIGRERMKRAKSKEQKSPTRIQKRNMYEKELKNLPRKEAKNILNKLFRNYKINFRTYAYLEGVLRKPQKRKRRNSNSNESVGNS